MPSKKARALGKFSTSQYNTVPDLPDGTLASAFTTSIKNPLMLNAVKSDSLIYSSLASGKAVLYQSNPSEILFTWINIAVGFIVCALDDSANAASFEFWCG